MRMIGHAISSRACFILLSWAAVAVACIRANTTKIIMLFPSHRLSRRSNQRSNQRKMEENPKKTPQKPRAKRQKAKKPKRRTKILGRITS